jgi:hypothetical protein
LRASAGTQKPLKNVTDAATNRWVIGREYKKSFDEALLMSGPSCTDPAVGIVAQPLTKVAKTVDISAATKVERKTLGFIFTT